jgi:hypothetical protein
MQENSTTRASEGKTPAYCRLVASMKPLAIGPIVCPTSIVDARNPIDVPTTSLGTSSLIKGEVEAVTVAKPKP